MAYETGKLDYAAFFHAQGYRVEVEYDQSKNWTTYLILDLEKDVAERLLVESFDRRCPTCKNSVRTAYESRRFLRGLSER